MSIREKVLLGKCVRVRVRVRAERESHNRQRTACE